MAWNRGNYQFIGIDKAVQAYESNAMPAWALFMGKDQLLCKYQGESLEEGSQVLEQFLERIEPTSTIYTLKVYELAPTQKIKSNTACDGSFNFRLTEEPEKRDRYNRETRPPKPYEETLAYKMDKLIEIMQGEEEEEEIAPPKEMSIGDRIGTVVTNTIERALNDPDEAMKWVNLFQTLTGRPTIVKPASIGAVSTSAAGGGDTGTMLAANMASDQERLAQALQTLDEADPKLIEHLEKLADMAKNNRAMFNVLTGMLDKK